MTIRYDTIYGYRHPLFCSSCIRVTQT